ncbi:MAG TPA: hypothetical protein VFY78_07595, partial [Gammaproteobacteria bacterium]|nr:hypothetical protein [Gammaproteobacteria bacterium]
MAETDTGQNERWLTCPPYSGGFYQHSPPPVFADDQKQATRISASQVESTGGISLFTGDVLIERDGLRLQAENIQYNKTQQTIDITSKLHIDAENL